ncbi:GNAT family N-acetyltransferase [Devosia sp. RR2S18]|uniref:GNAT family N-acetyltransferase n=1 Tax=Devosia rhizosphaerae TaxID=3049774 RepID=UPI00253FFE5D|nr:GNAT family N-acetyltransferase [Devosia sp. RR2S18]WIJ26304.1 GNAT family N-acetyltransferase [Devosia sp. RR2S18]
MIAIKTDPFPSDAMMRELWQLAWGIPGPESFQPILKHSLAHVGAYHSERLVGFVNVAWDGGVHAFLLDTCVLPELRRRGIASRLVGRAQALATQRGAEWLHVDFEPQLGGFYRACGFQPTKAGLIRLT